ncbi:MAG: DUF1206 domain-containing protein [Gemmatimonadota bacterium]
MKKPGTTPFLRALVPAVETMARIGFAAKGAVGITVAVIALRVALGFDDQAEGPHGALRTILHQPFGEILLAFTGLGLICYAAWQVFSALTDPEGKGVGPRGLVERLGFGITGLAYASLGVAAFTAINGETSPSMDTEAIATGVLHHFAGRFLIGSAGIVIMIAAVLQARLGITGRFRRQLRLNHMTVLETRGMSVLGRVGYVALGLTSFLTGAFLLLAALRYDPREAAGLDEILELILAQPFGRWLLGFVALGLALYGIYSLLLSRFHHLLDQH